MLRRLGQGELDELLADEARSAEDSARLGDSLLPAARAIRVFDRCCLPFLVQLVPRPRRRSPSRSWPWTSSGTGVSRALLQAQEEEAARRLVEAEEQAARAQERAREALRANEALSKSERQSLHRAEQIGLLASVTRRIAGILEPDRLMQEAAEAIQGRLDYSYVAVVVLDARRGAGGPVGRPGRSGPREPRPRPGAAGRDHRSGPAVARTPGGERRGQGSRLPAGRAGHALRDGGSAARRRSGGRGHRLPEHGGGGLRSRRRGRGRDPGRLPGRGPAQRPLFSERP